MKTKKLLIFVLTFAICLIFCACGNEEIFSGDGGSKKNEVKNPTKFTVAAIDQDGNAVEGVMLKVKKNSTISARTDYKGLATFPPIVSSGYKLFVVSCPDGYEYTGVGSIPINPDKTEIILKITKK